jgi:signal transduction histidine kinase
VPVPDPPVTAELPSGPSRRFLPASGLAGVVVVIGITLAGFVAQWVTIMTWVAPAQVSTVWVSGGLMLGLTLLTEPRRWLVVIPAAATGTALLYLILRLGSVLETIVFGLFFGIITVLVASGFRLAHRGPFALATLREFLTYLVIVVVGGAVVASSLFVALTAALGYRPGFLHWRTLALAVVLGYLTMTPALALLAQGTERLRSTPAPRWLEAALLGVLLALASGLVFSGRLDRSLTWTAFALTLPPLLLWSAMRFGTLGASAALLVVSVVSTLSTSRGLGPFSGRSPADNTLSLQLFILGTGLPLLGLAVVLGQQKRTRAALRTSHGRLEGLTRELIAAREEEGTRIGRELDDDVGQRLALVLIGLNRLRHPRLDAGAGQLQDIIHLQDQTSSIARSLREISHKLHPAALEHVGLSLSLQMMCDEIRHTTDLDVRWISDDADSTPPPDVALCLYRVAQQALEHAVRHSGARRVDLSLRREENHLVLGVRDDGSGIERPGLRYATERVHSIGGTLAVDSTPGVGTTVRVLVPLGTANSAEAGFREAPPPAGA